MWREILSCLRTEVLTSIVLTPIIIVIVIVSTSSPSIEVISTSSSSKTMTLRLILRIAIRFTIRSKHSKGVRYWI